MVKRGNVTQAARLLGISRDTLRYRLERLDLGRRRLRIAAPAAASLPPLGDLPHRQWVAAG
jgi:DNA-binding transcriptional LysR family regulator